jgi:hypothetical protein
LRDRTDPADARRIDQRILRRAAHQHRLETAIERRGAAPRSPRRRPSRAALPDRPPPG